MCRIVFERCTFNYSMYGMFSEDTYLTYLRFNNCYTSNVTNFQGMVYHCTKLTHLDVSNFDVSSAETFYLTFDGCSLLEEIYGLTTWTGTSYNLKNIRGMFCSLSTIKYINCNNCIYTYYCENFRDCFWNCPKLEFVDIHGWSMYHGTNLTAVFSYDSDKAKSLKCVYVNKSYFDVSISKLKNDHTTCAMPHKVTSTSATYNGLFVYFDETAKFENILTSSYVSKNVSQGWIDINYDGFVVLENDCDKDFRSNTVTNKIVRVTGLSESSLRNYTFRFFHTRFYLDDDWNMRSKMMINLLFSYCKFYYYFPSFSGTTIQSFNASTVYLYPYTRNYSLSGYFQNCTNLKLCRLQYLYIVY